MKTKNQRQLDKFGIAAALQEIAALQELKGGESRFKAKAYQAGARAIAGVSEDLGRMIEQDRLTTIPRIGSALASQIKQLFLTGSSSVLEGLRAEFPPGIIELSGVEGLSISKIKTLHEELGITSVVELEAAARAGKLRDVKGFGVKSEEKLLAAITSREEGKDKKTRLHIHHAERVGEQIASYLASAPGLNDLSVAGSLRRSKETVGVVRLVASSKKPSDVIQYFTRFPSIIEVVEQSDESCTVLLNEGSRVSLTVVSSDQFPLALLSETGSAAHTKHLKQLAQTKNLELTNRELIVKGKSRKRPPAINVEKDVYRRLGLQYIPPELRENEGEIEAALKEKLPEDLIAVEDIQGMVHCHTTYSDGKHTILQMAQAAESMGMKYLTITDHSPTAFYAGGVTVDRLQRQWEEIDEVQEKVKIKLLRGTESDIVADGSLDYPDSILERFDVIVASIHSRYKMDAEKMTKRLITAMKQPVFKIWGHAFGRLIQRRPPFECDLQQVLDVIAESRAAIEVNGDPYRLDMEPRWLREARKRKIKFVISVDAHSMGAMNNLKYGVGIARRGWVRKAEVLNAFGTQAFRKAVKPA
jgi:DNA polymerase (family 10)